MFIKFYIFYIILNYYNLLVQAISKHPILIVVSYDAFRYDFFNKKQVLPKMAKLREAGTYSDYLINVFPTKTFPNHHSIATGLYAEVHGVIGNTYFNKETNKVQNLSYEMYHYNENVVPIWRHNEDMGDERYSGSMMWPGASYPYQNQNITYIKQFSFDYDWFKRIDDVISWITNPHKPANLVMVYFEEPDTHGHAFGPDSKVIEQLLAKLDNVTQYLQDKLVRRGIADKVNVIHVSDHGLVTVKPPHFINITQYLTPGTYNYAGSSPCLQIIPKDGYQDEIYRRLKNASQLNGHFSVYKKNEYPDRWHYGDNSRSPPILVMADVGYALDDLILLAPKYAKKYNFTISNSTEFGVHGYDYTVKDMHPIFMARGPKIKKHHKVEPFNTVDLFNLFCKILEIPTLKNNGTESNIVDILKQHIPNTRQFTVLTILLISVGAVLFTLTVTCLVVAIILFIVKRQQKLTTQAALNKRFPQFTHATIEAQHLLESEET